MKIILLLLSLFFYCLAGDLDAICKSCHPDIYNEYLNSSHSKSSLNDDELHFAFWQIHPNKQTQNYTCKECHAPQDGIKSISCIDCHQISNIENGKNFNHNKLISKEKYFFGADANQKGLIKSFQKNDSLFGLFSNSSGSPFHTIDYSNQNFYDGKMCMGCHSHNTNANNIDACRMNPNQTSEQNCITCHMPQVKGSTTSIKSTKTHAFHGFAGIYNKSNLLQKYFDINIKKQPSGIAIMLHNQSPHDLTLHPSRVGVLRIKINNQIKKELTFEKVFSKNGVKSASWDADRSTTNVLMANERKIIQFQNGFKKGDFIEVEFFILPISKENLNKLKIKNQKFLKPIIIGRANLQY